MSLLLFNPINLLTNTNVEIKRICQFAKAGTELPLEDY